MNSLPTVMLLCCITLSSAAKPKRHVITMAEPAKVLVEKVNDAWQQGHPPEVSAFWDEAAYMTGNMEAYKLTGKATYLEYSDKWARHNKWCGAKEPCPRKWLYKEYGESDQHVLFGDWQTCFQTYLDMYEMNPDPYKAERAREVVDYMVAQEESDYWWWVDALYMAMPVFSKMYAITKDTKYLDKMTACFLYADSLMWDAESKLYYRDGKYIYPAHKTDNGKKDFWARGNGWAIAALAKVLTDMPEGYGNRQLFLDRYMQLAEGVAACQQEEGHWTRSMIDPEQAEGYETSGTAFMAYGLLWGLNAGLLPSDDYQQVALKAWNYLTTIALQPDYTIGYVQPIGERAIKGQVLTPQNTANFGTGAFILAASEKARFDDFAGGVKKVGIRVVNDGNAPRNEVVEMDAAEVYLRLGIGGGRHFVVKNPLGNEVPYQLTYDGKILLEATVRPKGSAIYTIETGYPSTFRNTCYGRMYPERVDDIAWENDRGAYRCYGPALQASGEDAYGNDVWVKNTPDLVVEQRYYNELEKGLSYHVDHGDGLDCYKVGPTLGCGAPALMDGDNIVFPYCYTDYELLDNGPLRFSVKLVYNNIETRIISIDKGSNFNKMTVTYGGAGETVDVASGVVIHTEDTQSIVLGEDYVAYADPTDNPTAQNFQIYVGAVFPDGVDEVRKIMYDTPTRGNAGHALGIRRGVANGEPVTYYFGSAWSKFDCHSMDEWVLRIENLKQSLREPLRVEIF